MKKPELLVTPINLENMKDLIEVGADAFVIGQEPYGLRLAGEFSREDVLAAVQLCREKEKKVYVAVNALFHNDQIDDMTDYVAFLGEANVDAIIWGDPAVLMAVREKASHIPLHWNTETTATNWFTCNYWGERGSKRAVLARELSLDAITEILENVKVEVEVQIQGMTCMFQSKRELVGNYYQYLDRFMSVGHDKEANLFLHDKERGAKYPLFQDSNGTHIMSPNDICMIDELEEFMDNGVHSLKIDGILKSPSYMIAITKLYRKAIDLYVEDADEYEAQKGALYSDVEELQPINRPLDTGFFFKETVY